MRTDFQHQKMMADLLMIEKLFNEDIESKGSSAGLNFCYLSFINKFFIVVVLPQKHDTGGKCKEAGMEKG